MGGGQLHITYSCMICAESNVVRFRCKSDVGLKLRFLFEVNAIALIIHVVVRSYFIPIYEPLIQFLS